MCVSLVFMIPLLAVFVVVIPMRYIQIVQSSVVVVVSSVRPSREESCVPSGKGSGKEAVLCPLKQKGETRFAVRPCQPHRGHCPGSMMYLSCGPLEHARFLEPSMDVRKKCAPGSTHEVYM